MLNAGMLYLMYHQKKHTTYVPKSELDILPSDHFEIINTRLLCKLALLLVTSQNVDPYSGNSKRSRDSGLESYKLCNFLEILHLTKKYLTILLKDHAKFVSFIVVNRIHF